MRALWAISAIFRTPPGLYGKQAAELDASRIMEFTMRLLGQEEKVGQRLPVDTANFFTRPVMA
jgi:hypothetical protein